jgi:serine/threonine protein phosphatase PrpC
MDSVLSAGLTHVGKRRKENQDALLLDDGLGLYAVSDGMGGHRAGEVASSLVVSAVREAVQRPPDPSREIEPDTSLSPAANRLRDAILAANRSVFEAAAKNPAFRGMGATVSTVLLTGESIIAANVGDSPIYLVHDEYIESLSVPHTLAAEHAAMNGSVPLDRRFHHVLTRAVGTRQSVEPALCELPRSSGDTLVIGSDGLSNLVNAEEIRYTVQRYSPHEACQRLVSLANERGGNDNITVLVVKTGHKKNRFKRFLIQFIRFFWSKPSPPGSTSNHLEEESGCQPSP